MRKLLVFILMATSCFAFAQGERGEIRDGNKLYKSSDYKGAEIKYRSALQTKGDSYEAMSNLGNALFKQKLSAESQEIFKKVVQSSENRTHQELVAAHYNLGNSYLQERKLDEAIESYKSALRLNPKDENARFNLAYAQKLKQEDDGGGGQNPQNQDQNQDKNKDENQDQKDNKDGQQEQPKPESRQDAERMLKALQDAENRTKDKVDKNKPKEGVGNGRNKQW